MRDVSRLVPMEPFQEPSDERLDLVEALPELRHRLEGIIALCTHAKDFDLIHPGALLAGCLGHAERALAVLEAAT